MFETDIPAEMLLKLKNDSITFEIDKPAEIFWRTN